MESKIDNELLTLINIENDNAINWDMIRKFCSVSETVPAETINSILKTAARCKEWFLVKELCAKEKNRLEQKAMEDIFDEAVNQNELNIVKFFAEPNNTGWRPSQLNLKEALISATIENHKEMVAYLCSRVLLNQYFIGKLVKFAAKSNNVGIIEFFYSYSIKPTAEDSAIAFAKAVKKNHIASGIFLKTKLNQYFSPDEIDNALLSLIKSQIHGAEISPALSLLIPKVSDKALTQAFDWAVQQQNQLAISLLSEVVTKHARLNINTLFFDNALIAVLKSNLTEEQLSSALQLLILKVSDKGIEGAQALVITDEQKNKALGLSTAIKRREILQEKARAFNKKYKTDQVVKDLMQDQDWANLIEIILDETNEQLSKNSFNHFINKAYESKNLRLFQRLCTIQNVEFTIPAIKSIMELTLKNKEWDYIEALCFFPSEEIPSQFLIKKVLKEAANSSKWELIDKICSLEGNKAPDQSTIDSVFKTVCCSVDNLKIIQELNHFSTKISTEGIGKAMLNLLSQKQLDYPLIEFLCFDCKFSKGKLSTETIEKIVTKAACKGELSLVDKLCTLALNQDSIDFAFEKMLFTSENLSIFKKLKTFQLKISTEGLNKGIGIICRGDNETTCWEFLNYLCFDFLKVAPNGKGKEGIDIALKHAARNHQWAMAQKIIEIEGENKPSQDAIDYCSRIARTSDNWDLIEYFSLSSPIKLSQVDLDLTLNKAADNGKWELVTKLCSSKDNPPSLTALKEVFIKAAKANQLKIIEMLHCLVDEEVMGIAFLIAVSEGYIDIIHFFMTSSKITGWDPKQEKYFGPALFLASQKNKLEVVKYFCDEMKNWLASTEVIGQPLNQETYFDSKKRQRLIGTALSVAINFGSIEVIEYFLSLALPFSPTFLAILVNDAAQFHQLGSLKCLSEKLSSVLEQSTFESALLKAIKNKDKSDEISISIVAYLIPKVSTTCLEDAQSEAEKLNKNRTAEILFNEIIERSKPVRPALPVRNLSRYDGFASSVNQSSFKTMPLPPLTTRAPNQARKIDDSIERITNDSGKNSNSVNHRNQEPEHCNTDSSQESEDSNTDSSSNQESETEGCGINMNLSMQVLGFFIGALGIASVALAFTVLAASSGGIAAVVVGTVALVIGLGLFAKGTYETCVMNSSIAENEFSLT